MDNDRAPRPSDFLWFVNFHPEAMLQNLSFFRKRDGEDAPVRLYVIPDARGFNWAYITILGNRKPTSIHEAHIEGHQREAVEVLEYEVKSWCGAGWNRQRLDSPASGSPEHVASENDGLPEHKV